MFSIRDRSKYFDHLVFCILFAIMQVNKYKKNKFLLEARKIRKMQLFPNSVEEHERENFLRGLISENIHRGKILALVLIAVESILATIDIVTALLKVDSRFSFDKYLIMYLILIVVNISYLVFLNRVKDIKNTPQNRIWIPETGIIVYVTFIMSWGSVISLMDQKLYGQIIVFMVNMITCSTNQIFFLLMR